LSLGD